MSIFFFSIISLLFLLLVANNFLKRQIKLFLFFIYGVIGFSFLFLNFNPSVETFTNADKHVVSATGFNFNNHLPLYHYDENKNIFDTANIKLNEDKDHSILGSEFGGFDIIINGSDEADLVLNNFTKPLYLRSNDAYILQNPLGEDFFKNSVEIDLEDGRNTQIKLVFNEEFPLVQVHISDALNQEGEWIPLHKIKKLEKLPKYGYPLRDFLMDNIDLDIVLNDGHVLYPNLKQAVEYLPNFSIVRKIKGDANSDFALIGNKNIHISAIRLDGQPAKFNNTKIIRKSIKEGPCDFSLSFNPKREEKYQLTKSKESGFYKLINKNLQWYPLYAGEEKGEKRIFFTSNPATIIKTVFNKGIYVQANKNEKSNTSVDASINYVPQKSNVPFELNILDHHMPISEVDYLFSVKSNSEFQLNTKGNKTAGLSDNKVFREFKLLNLEEQSKFKPSILYIMYGFVFISLFLLFYIRNEVLIKINGVRVYRDTISDFLMPAGLVILSFMTIKFFLLWRSSIFIPINDLTEGLYYNLNNANYLFRNTIAPFVIFILIAYLKKFDVFSFEKINFNINPRLLIIIPYISLLAILVFRGLNLHLAITVLDRISAIYIPIILYFFSYYFIRFHLKESNIKPQLLWINFIFYSLFFLYADTGFSIIFILFVLIKQIALYLNVVKETPDSRSRLTYLNYLIQPSLLVFVILFIVVILFSNYIVSLAFDYFQYLLIGGILLMNIFFIVLLFTPWRSKVDELTTYFKQGFRLKKASALVIYLIVALSSAYIIFQSTYLTNEVTGKYVHIKYRSQSLVKEIKDIIAEEDFGKYNSRKIVETATNKWFLSYFLEKGSKVDYFNFKKPYHLQKHFKHGVSYQTQSTDVIVSRYIIGEHGRIVPILLSLLFLVLFIYLLYKLPVYYENEYLARSLISVMAVGFLLVISLFVNLTVTNKFIFFGQDFPLLSLQSLLSPLVFFSSFIGLVLFYDPDQTDRAPVKKEFFTPPKINNYFLPVLILLFFVAIPYAIYKNNPQDTFRLGEVFYKVKQDFDYLNKRLEAQQSVEGFQRPTNIAELFDDIELLENTDEFSLSLYENLKKVLSTTDNNNLFKINESGKLGPLVLKENNASQIEISVQNNFYDLPSPDAFEKMWKGSLVAKNLDNSSIVADISNLDKVIAITHSKFKSFGLEDMAQNVVFHVLPASWFYKQNHDVVAVDLVSGTKQVTRANYKILRANDNLETQELSSIATRLFNEDIVNIENKGFKKQYFYASENITYFAKNIWLNGDFRHFYLYGESFILAYNIVENLKSDDGLNRKKENIELTLDYQLHQAIQKKMDNRVLETKNRFRNHPQEFMIFRAMNMNLIVMNGDGEIVSINDGKVLENNFYLNPNEPSSIYQTRLKLISNYNSKDEEKVFGNNNLLSLETGPQSTIKPIMFSAVASGYNFHWNALEYLSPAASGDDILIEQSDGTLTYRLFSRKSGTAISLDNGAALNNYNSQNYLSLSSNSYNILVAMLGSYTKEDLSNIRNRRNISDYFIPYSESQPDERFPRFSYMNQTYVFKYKPNFDYKNRESVFAKQFFYNYKFRTAIEDKDEINLLPYNKGKNASTWVNPVNSHFLMSDRINLHDAVVQVVSGASPMYATPLKMAQMYGKLFSGNKDFNLFMAYDIFGKSEVLSNNDIKPADFSLDKSWTTASWFDFLRSYIFKPMNDAISIGTARGLSPVTSDYSDYYFYAKTGTGGNKERFPDVPGSPKVRNKHFVLIISKEPLHQGVLTAEIMKENKFLVLFFSTHNGLDTQDFSFKRELIREVMESDHVKHYFNQ